MTEQTPVEWFAEQAEKILIDLKKNNNMFQLELCLQGLNELEEQAKQMEREQREQLFNQSIKDIKSYVKSLNTENNKIYKDNEILIMSCFSSAMEIIESTFNK